MIQRTITRNIKQDYLFTTSLKPLPALNAGTFEAGIFEEMLARADSLSAQVDRLYEKNREKKPGE